METMITKTEICNSLFFTVFFSAFSQDLNNMKDAFTNSYAYEKNKDYSKAIRKFKKFMMKNHMRQLFAWDGFITNLVLTPLQRNIMKKPLP